MRFIVSGCLAAALGSSVCGCSQSNSGTAGMGANGLDAAPLDGAGSDGGAMQGPGGGDAAGADTGRGDSAGPDADGSTNPGADGSGMDGASPGDGAPNLGPPPTPVCPPGATWGQGTQLAISTAADDFMGAITPDELTIAWVSANGSNVSVLYGDRASASAAFGTSSALPTATGYYATPKVALSPDGLRLVVVKTDHSAFAVTTRASRASSFAAAPGGGEVDAINTSVAAGETVSLLGDPVIGATDTSFYFSTYGAGAKNTLFESVRTDTSPWPGGVLVPPTNGAFAGSGTVLRHPTGVSADDLTLFYWDDVDTTEKVAWRPRTTDPFGAPVTLGARQQAAPNATCDKLYYSSPGSAGGLDLFVASRQ